MNIIAIGFGGFIGSILRYLIDRYVPMINDFPLGTLIVNLLGCFILGWMVFKLTDQRNLQIKLGMTTGVIGSFTTFSTFSVDALSFIAMGDLFSMILYVGVTVFGGIFLALIGANIAQHKGDNDQ